MLFDVWQKVQYVGQSVDPKLPSGPNYPSDLGAVCGGELLRSQDRTDILWPLQYERVLCQGMCEECARKVRPGGVHRILERLASKASDHELLLPLVPADLRRAHHGPHAGPGGLQRGLRNKALPSPAENRAIQALQGSERSLHWIHSVLEHVWAWGPWTKGLGIRKEVPRDLP